jgi:hypothetical protein
MSDRKASDILLDLELKIDKLIASQQSNEMLYKALYNKLNQFLQLQNNQQTQQVKYEVNVNGSESKPNVGPQPSGMFSISAPEIIEKPILEQEEKPNFSDRRGSRDFSPAVPKEPIRQKEVIAEIQLPPTSQAQEFQPKEKEVEQSLVGGTIPVIQRVIDKNGKVVFLAEVDIYDRDTLKLAFKTKTNGMGKWMASLKPGTYKVRIEKKETLSKPKIESYQELVVKEDSSRIDLQTFIIK